MAAPVSLNLICFDFGGGLIVGAHRPRHPAWSQGLPSLPGEMSGVNEAEEDFYTASQAKKARNALEIAVAASC